MNHKLSLVAIASLGIVAGCGSKSDKISDASKSSSGNHYSLADVEIDIPKEWTVLDPSKGDLDQAMDNLVKQDPKNQQLVGIVKQMAANKMFKLFAFDMSTAPSGFAENLNIIVMNQADATLDQLIQQSSMQVKMIPGGKIKKQFAKEKIGSSEFAVGSFEMKNSQGQGMIANSYSAVSPSKQYIFTYTSSPANADKGDAKMHEVLQTVKLK